MLKKLAGVGILVSVVALGSVAVASANTSEANGRGSGCRLEVAATVLETTVEDLQQAREDGESIREMIAEAEITEAEIEAAKADCIAEAVSNGDITQEQADAILSGERPERQRGDGERPEPTEEQLAELASDLGISVDELESRLANDQSPREIANELGVELERGPRGNGPGGRGGPNGEAPAEAE